MPPAACSKLLKRAAQSGPSSATMRRRTNAGPMGGACDCSCDSSCAYSAGSASGMVASSCATFMIGPLRPPSAAASAAALLASSPLDAEQPLAGDPGGHRADIGADAHVARRPRGEPVLLLVLAVGHGRPSWCPVYRVRRAAASRGQDAPAAMTRYCRIRTRIASRGARQRANAGPPSRSRRLRRSGPSCAIPPPLRCWRSASRRSSPGAPRSMRWACSASRSPPTPAGARAWCSAASRWACWCPAPSPPSSAALIDRRGGRLDHVGRLDPHRHRPGAAGAGAPIPTPISPRGRSSASPCACRSTMRPSPRWCR